MRRIKLLLFPILFPFFHVHAQESLLNFKETEVLIDGVTTNVMQTTLKGSFKDVNKSFTKFAKKQLDIRLKDKRTHYLAKEVTINQITDKRGDLIMHSYNDDHQVTLSVGFQLGYDVYLNSEKYPDEFKKLTEFLEFFVYQYYNDYLPKLLKDQSKELKALEKEKKDAEKQISKSDKKIKKAKSVIKRSSSKLKRLEKKDATEKITTKMASLQEKIKEAKSVISYEEGSRAAAQDLVTKIDPKIDAITQNIQEANITLLDVRAKMKLYDE